MLLEPRQVLFGPGGYGVVLAVTRLHLEVRDGLLMVLGHALQVSAIKIRTFELGKPVAFIAEFLLQPGNAGDLAVLEQPAKSFLNRLVFLAHLLGEFLDFVAGRSLVRELAELDGGVVARMRLDQEIVVQLSPALFFFLGLRRRGQAKRQRRGEYSSYTIH